jgi:G8 domain
MPSAISRCAIFNSLLKTFISASIAISLLGAVFIASSGAALAAPFPDPCPTGFLDKGTGLDIVIYKECHVGAGTYNYRNVNIIQNGTHKGKLVFDELIPDVKIDFWANSILVENEGSLIAGTPAQPFGSQRGKLTIHLYGMDLGSSGTGIICQSPPSVDSNTPCGIPYTTWSSNGGKKVFLPAAPPSPSYTDYFYQYQPLPFDDGEDAKKNVGFFGYKVLAVSYGGTLQLFGNKGADYTIPDTGTGPKDSGKSWVRLAGTIFPGDAAKILTVASPSDNSRLVDWQVGDHIVVTTTDYLPNHSEELVICSVDGNKIGYTSDTTATPVAGKPETCPVKGVNFTHNGEKFQFGTLPSRLNYTKTEAESRAAVGLLTRSIRIVSEGAMPNSSLPAPTDPSTDRYFGGHTIARQGFKVFQVQGVEFRQMGQGGRLGHYPLHFHMARQTPSGTFVKDSSINESMTRWITVHATQGVTLARNVGYLSIGHGFYLEDGVETNNRFYSNLGIFARAAVTNDQNPRNVPGILASPDAIVFRPPPGHNRARQI